MPSAKPQFKRLKEQDIFCMHKCDIDMRYVYTKLRVKK